MPQGKGGRGLDLRAPYKITPGAPDSSFLPGGKRSVARLRRCQTVAFFLNTFFYKVPSREKEYHDYPTRSQFPIEMFLQ